MTHAHDNLNIDHKLVVVFDMCSSSTMLEDLIVRHDLLPMRNLLIAVKKFLQENAESLGFEPYKFIGDGWILLFPPSVSGKSLIRFLEELSRLFGRKLRQLVLPHLENEPSILGLTFGVDVGPLVRLTMMHKSEYLGRPINIASRLQSAIKDRDDNPGYKVLFSRPAFRSLRVEEGFRKTKSVSRTLKNIRNGQRYECVKLWLKT